MSYVPTARGNAFRAEARRRGLETHLFDSNRPREDYWPRRHEVFAEWLAGLPKPIGVLSHVATMAQDLTAAATLAGVNVPQEVAVLTCAADDEECCLSQPALSTIAANVQRAGFESAHMLDRLLKGESPDSPLLIRPTHVVHRASTDILAVSDPLLARAIRLLRDRATDDEMRIEDVLKDLPLTRNQLEYGLRRTLGRSPYEEVLRIRLDAAQRLLRETTMDLANIAVHSGLGTSSNLCKVFKRNTGQTPRQYRLGRGP